MVFNWTLIASAARFIQDLKPLHNPSAPRDADGPIGPWTKSADPKDFYDNSIVQAVNREYASKLFPGEVK